MDVTDNAPVSKVKDAIGEKTQKLFQDFLEIFKPEGSTIPKYKDVAKELIRPERNTLEVSFDDVETFNQRLATTILEEYYRVYPYVCAALKLFIQDMGEDIPLNKDVFVSFTDVAAKAKVRELTTAKVGTLLRITGQVVRTHPVHPELVKGTFVCLDCQTVIKDVEQQFKYTQPSICRNPTCNNRTRFMLDVAKSSFVDFQKVRIQETQAELPMGSIPRTVEIILRAEAVEVAQAGDKCDFTGTLIVVPDVRQLNVPGARAEAVPRGKNNQGYDMEGVHGLKALGVRDLNYRMAFLACTVQSTNLRFGGRSFDEEDMDAEKCRALMTPAEWNKVYQMSQDKNIYSNLCDSLFPTIHGSEEVKRGVLLMLFGGVPKKTDEGTNLRGDVNICLVGDPSTAKSQILKMVEEFSPRAVYTSGKASTAAGLTAAVVKDEESYDFVIEAGALMLADNGVCCIDEFDKMDLKDQVAIHEAMEQQTISITKAGVKATLNARASILAAANPVGGRYDRSKPLRQNIAMSAPIMSRFDLFFILVDECNEVIDYAIARKIVDLHCALTGEMERVYHPDDIQRFIMFARNFKPKLTKESQEFIVEEYKRMRQRDSSGTTKSAWRITVRQLESIIRLSEAMAKLHCQEEVKPHHVKEACRLLNKSIIRVEQPDIQLEEDEEPMNLDEEAPPSPTPDAAESEADGEQTSQPSTQPKKQTYISYENFKQMSNLLVHHVRQQEQLAELAEDGDEAEGLRKSDLINWYLKEMEHEIDSEAELLERKSVVEKVIHKLVNVDHVFVQLTQTGMKSADSSQPSMEEDPILVLHPNFAPHQI